VVLSHAAALAVPEHVLEPWIHEHRHRHAVPLDEPAEVPAVVGVEGVQPVASLEYLKTIEAPGVQFKIETVRPGADELGYDLVRPRARGVVGFASGRAFFRQRDAGPQLGARPRWGLT
jgi:hypothetical protein